MERKKVIYEEDKKKITRDMMETNSTVRGTILIKVFKVFLILLILVIIRGMFGKIIINNRFGMYPASKNRYFLATINGTPVNVDVELKFNFPVIPFLLYIQNNYAYTSEYVKDDYQEYGQYKVNDQDKKYIFNLKSYECYFKGYRNTCSTFDATDKKEKPLNIKRMKIDSNNTEIYDGEYIEDITEYITGDGYYFIRIEGNYNWTDFSLDIILEKNIKNLIEDLED